MSQLMKCGDCGAVLQPRLQGGALFIDHRCSEAVDEGCICKGNWRAIVKEYAPMIGKTFKRGDKTYRFFGLVHGDDDYYYGLVEVGGKVVLSSCVGSLEMNGLEETDSPSAPLQPHSEEDGFGNGWGCPKGLPTGKCGMQIVRPGKVQCDICDSRNDTEGKE